ncbi:MAG: hypothetical protein VYA67_21740 [Actinomycetota bacterium]|nr:hypothetical protein [Actinomycetota bacterium]
MSADKQTRQLFALLRKAGPLDRDQRLALYRHLIWRNNIDSTNDLAAHEIEAVVTQLRTWDQAGALKHQVHTIVREHQDATK